MVDNFTTASGSGGNTYASDDIGGIHYPRVKLTWGVDGAVVDASATNPLPVVQTGTHNVTVSTALPAGTNNIGDVDVVTLPALPAGTNNIGDVDVLTLPALPAGTNNIGDVDVLSLPALPAGNNNIGDVDVATLPALPAGTNNIGDVDVLTLPALPAGTNTIGSVLALPAPTGGLEVHRSLDLDETEEEVKASAGTVYGWAITNRAATTRWIKFYNDTALNVTVGTTTPRMTWGIPGNASDNIAANMLGGHGINFSTAITVAATTDFADNDTGAPGANDVIINVFYR